MAMKARQKANPMEHLLTQMPGLAPYLFGPTNSTGDPM
jgi:hypothetical protein